MSRDTFTNLTEREALELLAAIGAERRADEVHGKLWTHYRDWCWDHHVDASHDSFDAYLAVLDKEPAVCHVATVRRLLDGGAS